MGFALEKELMMIGRLLIAGFCGGIIGHERENRRKPAGVRTHTVVGVASALMVMISKYGFTDVVSEYVRVDPSRVAAGVVTAISFLGSGIIIARNKSVSGITTSAGIWATVGVGLAVGSGMIYLGVATSIIVVLAEMFLGRGSIVGLHREALTSLTVEIAGGQGELLELKNCISEMGFHIRSFEFSQKEKGTLKANIVLGVPRQKRITELLELKQPWIIGLEVKGKLLL